MITPLNQSLQNISGIFKVYNGTSGVYRCVCHKGQDLDFNVDVRKLSKSDNYKLCPCYCKEIVISFIVIIVSEIIWMIVLIYRNRHFNFKSTTVFTNQII